MEDTILKSLEHAPDMVFAIGLVLLFLKFLKDQRKDENESRVGLLASHSKRTDEFISTVKDIHTAHAEARAASQVVIDRNTAALLENTLVMRGVSRTVEDANRR